jgi:hypothetical protein
MQADHHVKVIIVPGNTTHILQGLSLSFFGNLKKKKAKKPGLIKCIFYMMKETGSAQNARLPCVFVTKDFS